MKPTQFRHGMRRGRDAGVIGENDATNTFLLPPPQLTVPAIIPVAIHMENRLLGSTLSGTMVAVSIIAVSSREA
tara:strand:- start:1344 stop:1565 length:222 start_codon:yes stop_codon:yes gene_type:complete